jgi:hypothetical protein
MRRGGERSTAGGEGRRPARRLPLAANSFSCRLLLIANTGTNADCDSGTRGVPASYGGFETFAEQLSTRLVARGHEVTVYCRAHYVSPRQLEYKGVRLKVLPTIRHKYLTPSFTPSSPPFMRRRSNASTPRSSATPPTRRSRPS